ncbi:hypothetical protein CGZ80_12120 [Rhodopirellula sp. MGV]|nr:hypothetical protein CGZ80_12120 [Rhodopirellula sp. MGV]PNY36782.1 hypothetical protein C2E31_11270 [Rhodopirellula baltica]
MAIFARTGNLRPASAESLRQHSLTYAQFTAASDNATERNGQEANWQVLFGDGKLDPAFSKGGFDLEGGLLTANGDHKKMMLYGVPTDNFRIRITYKISDDGEAAVVFRSTERRPGNRTGYWVGLSSEKGWLYNIASPIRFGKDEKRLAIRPINLQALKTERDATNVVEVLGVGNRFAIFKDGTLCYEFLDRSFAEGQVGIAARHHGVEIIRFEISSITQANESTGARRRR